WVNPNIAREAISHQLTMSGLEVESCTPVAPAFKGVIVGEVVHMEKHPDADRLRVCEVKIKNQPHLNIVCGAQNVKVGMKVAVAMIGAELPNDLVIKPTTIRGVASQG